MKKFICMVLSVVMILGLSYSLSFGVVDVNYYGGKNLYDHHFISGSSSDSMVLNEEKNFTREQLAVLILEISGKSSAAVEANLAPNFVDNDEITWSAPYVAYCAREGLMGGSTVEGSALNRFNPKGIVTGQQLATVLYGALGYEAHWNTVLDDVAKLGLFVENKPLTRGEAFNFIWDAITKPVSADGSVLAVTLGKMTMEEVQQARDAMEAAESVRHTPNTADGSKMALDSLDTEDCLFKIADCRIDMDTMMCEVDFEMENKTLAKNLIFELESGSVNGVTIENNYFMNPVDAGEEKSMSTMLISMPSVEPAMEEFTDLQFMVRVVNEDDLYTPIARKTLHVYPQGEDKVLRYQRSEKNTDIVLVNTDDIKITAVGAIRISTDNDYVEHHIRLAIENKTDEYLSIYKESLFLDGVSVEEAIGPDGTYRYVYSPIGANEICFNDIEWVVDSSVESGKTETKNVEMELSVYPEESYAEKDCLVEKTITFSPFEKYEYSNELDFWNSY